MRPRHYRVLLSAYGCEPDKGSEPGVGWNMARGLAQRHEVWVLTRANNRSNIEAALSAKPEPNLHFIYYDLPRWTSFWKRGSRGIRLYYYLWQLLARKTVRRAHAEHRFDIAQHLTFVKYWFPSCLVDLDVPLIWGPVGGGEDAPIQFWAGFGLRGLVYECARTLARAMGECDPLVRRIAKQASRVYVTAARTYCRVRRLKPRALALLSEIAFSEHDPDFQFLSALPPASGRTRFISIGALLHWKGFHLGLEAFSKAAIGDAEYWIVGAGPQRRSLERLAGRLGIGKRVRFFGSLPRPQTLDLLSQCTAMVHPSLHDSGGWVVLEAMAAARPVICLNLGGPATQVTEDTGYRCNPGSPLEAIAGMADAMRCIANDRDLAARMGAAGRQRIRAHFMLANRVEYLTGVYASLIDEHEVEDVTPSPLARNQTNHDTAISRPIPA